MSGAGPMAFKCKPEPPSGVHSITLVRLFACHNSMPDIRWCSGAAILRRHCINLGMLSANSAFRDASASRITVPECKMVLGCAAIRASAYNHGEQSVVLYEISSLESAHRVWRSLTTSSAAPDQ